MRKILIILSFLQLTNVPALEITPRTFDSVEQEARYYRLTEEFRCVTCQNQSVAESNSKVALAIRDLVYTMLKNGETDEAIKARLVASYGDFVLYEPPFKSTTYFLWLGPLLILFIGLATLIYFIRRHTTKTTVELTEEERSKITHLLDDI